MPGGGGRGKQVNLKGWLLIETLLVLAAFVPIIRSAILHVMTGSKKGKILGPSGVDTGSSGGYVL
jgi:hypothetical protein